MQIRSVHFTVIGVLLVAVSLPSAVGQINLGTQLLDRYAAGQAAFTKIKVQYECSWEDDSKLSPPYDVHNGITKHYGSGVVFWDGTRCSHRTWGWGEVDGRGKVTPREEAFYNSVLYDGKRVVWFASRSRPGGTPAVGSGSVQTKAHPPADPSIVEQCLPRDDATLLGYLFHDGERIDAVLKRASQIQVARETDKSGKPGCFVLRAKTPGGMYAIWLDPERGYNIVRAECKRQAGDRLRIPNGTVLTRGIEIDYSMTITRFEQREGLWVPMEAVRNLARTNNGQYDVMKLVFKRTAVEISPDFKAAGAFVPDDIPDGTSIILDGQVYDRSGARFIWQKGEVVPEVEKATRNTVPRIPPRPAR